MAPRQAKRMVIFATVIAGGLAAAGQLSEDRKPGVRLVIGGFLASTLLGAATEFAPAVAGNLAALMLVTSVLVLGGPAWAALTRLTS